ncbi:hypothetical protein CAEBREN_06109 [Caenorhabditis brenneri]|uniref:3-oxo-5-alpha-steroid 4-dehydrogenase C-terminal domain-containing protein n=1 Tax=Caenorhabditis brenneri TaxID=135651 RepID=G0MSP6_CAEBE|nr:hypothetical protein CAEBREN_06109 [Caenorhabditis brenneri]
MNSLEHSLSVGFIMLGVWRLYSKEPNFVVTPYIDDLRSNVLFNMQNPLVRLIQSTLLMSILLCPSIKAKIAVVTLLASMWIDDYQYPRPASHSVERRQINSRETPMEIATFIILVKLLYMQHVEFSLFAIIKLLLGFHMFWIGYFGKLDFDEVLWFNGAYERRIRPGEPDLMQLNTITCPEYRYRIIQWIGFAILVDEQLIYCFSYCAGCFLIKYANTRHRLSVRSNPEIFGTLRALW